MRRTLPLYALVLLAAGCTPDSDSLVDDTSDTLAQPGLPDQGRLLGHVETLASDEFAGRQPGTTGGQLAEAYIEDHFEALGLAGAGDNGGFRQAFPLESFTVTGPSELNIDGTGYSEGNGIELFGYSGAGEVEAELVFVGYGLTVPAYDAADHPRCPLDPAGYDDYAGLDLEGKIAVVMRHGPSDDWDPDYVFDVSFESRLPSGFDAYGDHFDAEGARTVYAVVDRSGIDLDLDSLEMVIADHDCDRLIPSANDDMVTSLVVDGAGG